MRILVLHQHYWPEIAATAQILADLCEDLASFGHDVTVVCGQPSYRMSSGLGRLPAYETRRGVQIDRVWSYTPERRGIPQRLAHYASYFATSLSVALTRPRPDVCLVMSTPPLLLGVSGALLRSLRGVPFVYSVQDLYPDIAVHLGVIKATGPVAHAVNFVAKHSYAAAAELVTLSPGMAQSLIAKELDPERVHVVPNWADTSSVESRPRDNNFAKEHGLASGFVALYSGNLGQSQGLEHVLDAAKMLRHLPITFAFAGDGKARPGLEAQTKQAGLSNVRFLSAQPRDRLSDLLSSCDVGLVTMKKGVGDDLVPSKLYGIMAAARPVLAAVESSSEVARVLRTHDCGYITEPENGPALAACLVRAFEDSELQRVALGRNGRTACAANYSRQVLTRGYEAVLRRAAGQPGLDTDREPRGDNRPLTDRLVQA